MNQHDISLSRRVESLAWAYHTLSILFANQVPSHIREHLATLDEVIRDYTNRAPATSHEDATH